MSWRRLAPAVVGAGLAAAVAVVVNAATDPYAEKASQAYREGAQAGIVLRYAVMGGLFAWLVDMLVGEARSHGSLRAALATRGRPLLLAVGLLAIAGVAAIPLVESGYTEADARADHRRGFIDGCTRNGARRSYCACVWERLAADPRTDTRPELRAVMVDLRRTGTPPPPIARAIARCTR